MDKKKLQQILIGIPLVLVAVVFCYYKYLLKPLQEKQDALKIEIKKIESEYQENVGRAGRLPMLEQEIRVLNTEIQEMQKKLPHDKDVPGLIRLLSERMKYYGVQWKRLEPGAQSAMEYYIEHSYKIPFSSRYHNLARFLAEIGQMERIFATRISSLRPEADLKSGSTVSGEITFLIYTSR